MAGRKRCKATRKQISSNKLGKRSAGNLNYQRSFVVRNPSGSELDTLSPEAVRRKKLKPSILPGQEGKNEPRRTESPLAEKCSPLDREKEKFCKKGRSISEAFLESRSQETQSFPLKKKRKSGKGGNCLGGEDRGRGRPNWSLCPPSGA